MLRLFSVLLTIIFPVAPAALAHPHVWVDAVSEIVFDSSGRIAAIKHHWRFDDAFTAFAIQGLDTDGDGHYSKAELDPLAEVNVSSLSEFEYFTFMSVGDKATDFASPTHYWLELEDGFLTLHYTLPLAEPFKPVEPAVLEVYDPEYFVAFEIPAAEAVRLVGAPAGCRLAVRLAKELDESAVAALAEIGPDQRQLPEELKALTEGLDNSATVACS